jgi:hypothetical protein
MRDPGTPDRSGRGGKLDLATRVRVVQAAYSDAQHDLDAILTRPTLVDAADPSTADFLRALRTCEQLPRNGGVHRAENLLSGLIVLPVVVRDEILEAVRKPSRIEGVIGDSGTGGGMV